MIKIRTILISGLLAASLAMSGCAQSAQAVKPAEQPEPELSEPQPEPITDPEIHAEPEPEPEPEPESETEIFHFVDVLQNEYTAELNPKVKKMSYDLGNLKTEGIKKVYRVKEDEFYPRYEEKDIPQCSRVGIDVSHHNGDIDWEKVREDGYDFAFLRIAYRGYGQEGSLNVDKKFADNYAGAEKAGLDVGVYIFAQATNEEEAVEEADFVLKILDGQPLQLPVVYDPESILEPGTGEPVKTARTYGVTAEQFTKNSVAFCKRIEEAGYRPGIYANMKWEAYNLDLSELSDASVWYADYEDLPQTPYDFEFWQYTNTAKVSGVNGEVDLNIQIMDTSDRLYPSLASPDIRPVMSHSGESLLSELESQSGAKYFRDFLTGKTKAKYDGGEASIGDMITECLMDYGEYNTIEDESGYPEVYCQFTGGEDPALILSIRVGALTEGSTYLYHVKYDGEGLNADSRVILNWSDQYTLYENDIMMYDHGQHASVHQVYFDAREMLPDFYDNAAIEELINRGVVKLAIDSEDGTEIQKRPENAELDMEGVQEKEGFYMLFQATKLP